MYKPSEEKSFFDQTKTYLNKELSAEDLTGLSQCLKYHEWKYAVMNDPVISDYEYDLLFKKLQKIEEQNPLLILPDSPTQRVTSDLNEESDAVEHLTPMLSLGNSYNAEDLNDFDQSIKRLLKIDEAEEIEYCVEPKFDGGSIAVIYKNDLLEDLPLEVMALKENS